MVGGWIVWWVCLYGFVGGGVGGCVGWYVVDCVLARLTVGGDPLYVVISRFFFVRCIRRPSSPPWHSSAYHYYQYQV